MLIKSYQSPVMTVKTKPQGSAALINIYNDKIKQKVYLKSKTNF